MRCPAYPKYKDSGVGWLGEVPEGWEPKRLRFIARLQTGNTPPKSDEENYADEGLMWVKPDDLNAFEPIQLTKEFLSETGRIRSRPVPLMSALVCCIGTVGKFGYSEMEVATNQQINTVIFDQKWIHPKFGLYLTASSEAEHIRRTNINVVPILNATQQSNIKMPGPPLAEQHTIAAFLDRQTAKIDALLGKKRELIGKLKEKRTALISRTVTRGLPPDAARAAGLDPHPAMKPSGIEWLGEVPERWSVKRLSYLALLKSGENITSEQLEDDGDFPVFGGNGHRGYFSRYTHSGHYVLIGRQGALCGNINYAFGQFWASEHAIVVTPLTEFVTRWLGEVLRTMNLNQYSISAAQPGLSVSTIGALKIPAPPTEEQHAIAAFLDRETTKLDRLVAKIEEVISRLQEYRTALITAAVTGKIDVRGMSTDQQGQTRTGGGVEVVEEIHV